MPNQEELNAIFENLDQMQVRPDDTFRFKCYGCGRCCKNRDDILLNPQDLFRLAKHLKMEPMQVIEHYGETYIGDQSHVPIVRLKPVGKERVCPLLKEDNRCGVHASKPTVCALFPLGRYQSAPKADLNAPRETGYFVLPVTCGGHKQTTVRAYLESFGIPLEDEFYAKWTEMLMFLAGYCGDAIRRGVSEHTMDILWGVIFEQLYLRYNADQAFQPQFDANTAKLRKALEDIRTKTLQTLEQRE